MQAMHADPGATEQGGEEWRGGQTGTSRTPFVIPMLTRSAPGWGNGVTSPEPGPGATGRMGDLDGLAETRISALRENFRVRAQHVALAI